MFSRLSDCTHSIQTGVTHLPEVQKINLEAAFALLQQRADARNVPTTTTTNNNSSGSNCSGSGSPVNANNSNNSNDSNRDREGNNSTDSVATASGDATTATAPPPTTMTAEAVASSTLCLVLATDGVWDNWQYEDVNKFVMDPSCLGAVGAAPDGAKRVTISFMQRNALYAKRNFGSNADNATGIVMYLSRAPAFPAL